MNLEEANVAHNAACKVRNELISRRDEVRREWLARMQAALDAEFTVLLREAEKQVLDTLHARQVAEIANAREAASDVGVLMEEFAIPSSRHYTRNRERVVTGRRGIVEIIDHSSRHPDNLRWGRAYPGQRVIRLLNKDGTLSARYISSGYEIQNDWRKVQS